MRPSGHVTVSSSRRETLMDLLKFFNDYELGMGFSKNESKPLLNPDSLKISLGKVSLLVSFEFCQVTLVELFHSSHILFPSSPKIVR